MHALSNVKIMGKLSTIILVAIFGMIGIGAIGLHQMNKVFDAANFATINSVPSINALAEIRHNFKKMRIALLYHLLNTEDSKMAALDRDIQNLSDAITKTINHYEANLIADEEEKRLAAAIRPNFKAYLLSMDQVLALSRQNKNQEARVIAEKNATLADQLEDAIQQDIDYNKKLSAESSKLALTTLTQAIWQSSLIAAVMIALLCLWGWVIAKRTLAGPIDAVVSNLKQLADGRLDVTITGTERRDEVGDIARAAQVFKEFVQKIETQGWIKTHTAEIASELQQADELKSLAQLAISRIAKLLKAGHGVIYVADGNGRLNLLASYGHRERKQLNNSLAIGEGLIGQCAMEKSPITLSAPQDYIRINSGLGESPPACVAVLPILHQEKVLGVLEIASFQQFTERETALLDALIPTLATSMEILDRNLKTKELLAATQEQAERMEKQAAQLEEQSVEMEAQQAELMETENWFRSIIETAPDGMLVINESSTIVLSNPQAEILLGYTNGQLLGMPLREILTTSISDLPSDVACAIQARHKNSHVMKLTLNLGLLPSMSKHGRCVCLSLRAA